MAGDIPSATGGFWGLVTYFIQNNGPFGVVFLFLLYLFYKLIWKVWNGAMKSKDQEIERLVKERDWLQEQLMGHKRLKADPQEQPGHKKLKAEPKEGK